MRHRTSRKHLLIALVSAFVVLTSACSSGANDKARPEAAAGGSNGESTGRIPVYVYNGTDQTVILGFGAYNDTECQTNKWEYKGEKRESGRLDPLGPRSTVNDLYVTTSTCNDGFRLPAEGWGIFTFGVENGAKFEFGLYLKPPDPRARRPGAFDSLEWRGRYINGGDTKGLVQYNAGNNGILGSGNPGINNDFTYVRDQQIYFSYCPQVSGQKEVPGSIIPDSCRKP